MWENVKGMLALPDDPGQRSAAKQGLLNFGASLLAGQGNLGGILGNGLLAGSQGYQNGLAQQQQAAMQKIQQERWNLENQETKAKLDEPMQLQKILAGGGPGAIKGPPPSLPRLGAGPAGGSAPVSGAAPATASASAPAGQPDLYQTYLGYGDRLTQAGRPTQAKAYYDLAEKLRPELKEQVTRTVNGKRVTVNLFKDGSDELVDRYAPDLEKLHFEDTGAATMGLDPFTGKPVNTITNTVSPDARLSSDTARRGQNMADARAKADEQAPISADAILNAAARYNFDGTLPPMGMGKNAAAGRSAILNKAAELKYGTDPEQQRRDQLTNRGGVAAQNAAVKSFSDGKLGSTVRSFNVSISHLDTLDQLTDALHNGDAQAMNRASNYFKSQTGNPAPTNFEAAKKVVADEVVKAIVGTGGGVTDREEAAKTIAAANSPAQLKGVIGTYKELMRGQLHGLQQQYEVSTGRKDFDKFLSPAAQAVDKQHGPIKDLKDLPKKAAPAAQAYADAEKERRYQEWKRSQGK